MKTNLFQLSLLFLLCISVLCGCANDDEQILSTDGSTLTVHATADGFASADGVNTRASESGYNTTFTEGDQIGVFAVKDGQVITDCNNVPLTYNGTGWEGNAVYYYTGAEYFAYYPYDASIDSKTSVDDIVKDFTPQSNQSSYEDYTKSDLMTAEATPASDKTLNFKFEHKMSLIEISLSVKQNFKTSDTPSAYTYSASTPVTTGTSFSINNQSPITPYNMGGGVYRYIVPSSDVTLKISGEFNIADGKTIEYSKEGLSLDAGSYKRLNVSYDATVVIRPLAIGDYYYSDGSICPGDVDSPPLERCIGVVYCVDGNFIKDKSTNNALYPHALVVALEDAGRSDWYGASGLVSGYKSKVAAPDSSSDWYLPNLDELKYICRGNEKDPDGTEGKDRLNSSFKKLGVGNFAEDSYWANYSSNWWDTYDVSFQNGFSNYRNKGDFEFQSRAVLAF